MLDSLAGQLLHGAHSYQMALEVQAKTVATDVADELMATSDVRPVEEVMARSEEHTSELQSLMRISYAVFCLKKKKKHRNNTTPARHRQRTRQSNSRNPNS